MEGVIEATAELIEPPAAVSASERWVAECRERVAELGREFPVYEIRSADDYRQMKRDRAALRKKLAAITDERRDMTAEVESFVRKFRDDVRSATEPLDAVESEYASRIHGWEETERERRADYLREFYEEGCEHMATVVPFERVRERWARDGKWFAASTTDEGARTDLCKRVRAFGEDEQRVLDARYGSKEERRAAQRKFFECMDVGETLAWAEGQRRAAQKVAELDAKRSWRPEGDREAARSDATPDADQHTETPDAGPEIVVYRVEVPRPRVPEFIEAMKALGDVHGRRWEQ